MSASIHERIIEEEQITTMIYEVAALIYNNDKIMICQNSQTELWELVSGEAREDESLKQALIRAGRRQLGVTVTVGEEVHTEQYDIGGVDAVRHFYNCFIAYGTPIRFEHKSFRWITRSEISDFEFCEKDKAVLEKLTIL